MSFVSGEFIIFFAAVLIASWTLDKFNLHRIKEIFLFVASYVFYGYWDWRFCFLLLFVTVSSYFTAKYTEKKSIYCLGITIPLVVLAVFKYLNFFMDCVGLKSLKIILPVGISFYTFQALSYVIDVKRKTIKAEKDFVKFALYVSFFPQLVAGPIVRASDFLPQLYEKRKVKFKNILVGIQIIIFGAFKKLVIADHISVFVDNVFESPTAFHWATLYLGIISYAIQIYMDFSGYSDMAIGCAYCLGYSFKKNFNLPYLSQSFTELWSRWHISMSGWFTEYVFYPVASKTNKKTLQILAIVFTMFLSGLWHGAGWNFVLWGTLLGLLLAFEKIVNIKPAQKITEKLLRVFCVFNINSLLLVFFRLKTFDKAGLYLKGLFTLQKGVRHPFVWSFIGLFCVAIGYAAAIIRAKKNNESKVEGFYPLLNLNSVGGLTLLFVGFGLLVIFAYTGENPFVYFNF